MGIEVVIERRKDEWRAIYVVIGLVISLEWVNNGA